MVHLPASLKPSHSNPIHWEMELIPIIYKFTLEFYCVVSDGAGSPTLTSDMNEIHWFVNAQNQHHFKPPDQQPSLPIL